MNKKHHPNSREERIRLAKEHPLHEPGRSKVPKKVVVEHLREEETEHELEEFLKAETDGS